MWGVLAYPAFFYGARSATTLSYQWVRADIVKLVVRLEGENTAYQEFVAYLQREGFVKMYLDEDTWLNLYKVSCRQPGEVDLFIGNTTLGLDEVQSALSRACTVLGAQCREVPNDNYEEGIVDEMETIKQYFVQAKDLAPSFVAKLNRYPKAFVWLDRGRFIKVSRYVSRRLWQQPVYYPTGFSN
jgi:hypothetical protein